jgi:hypothetical protein
MTSSSRHQRRRRARRRALPSSVRLQSRGHLQSSRRPPPRKLTKLTRRTRLTRLTRLRPQPVSSLAAVSRGCRHARADTRPGSASHLWHFAAGRSRRVARLAFARAVNEGVNEGACEGEHAEARREGAFRRVLRWHASQKGNRGPTHEHAIEVPLTSMQSRAHSRACNRGPTHEHAIEGTLTSMQSSASKPP